MKEEITLTEFNKPIVWKHKLSDCSDRFYIVYANRYHQFALKARKDFAYQHAVAIEIFPSESLPEGLPAHFLRHLKFVVCPLIRFEEGTLEQLPVESFGMTRHSATCAMIEAEYFTAFPQQDGRTTLWHVDLKKVRKSIRSAMTTKNHSHVWKILAWLNWKHWNEKELPYKERTAILRGYGFTLGNTALKSAAQEKALTIPDYRRK
ncbi:MAG: hypothetical protein CAK88_08930 [Verrucomicrobiia bacterium AMD-G2]|jgi:hypothetical protein|nr:MAG: hypothetical protein CAK88_08930 [Verrucomicrobiae bacterium AMD-G2]